jgi:hypothetical protein
MASIPAQSGAYPEVMCTRIAERALAGTEVTQQGTQGGDGARLPFTSLGSSVSQGRSDPCSAIHVQVPSANGPHAHAASGMVVTLDKNTAARLLDVCGNHG